MATFIHTSRGLLNLDHVVLIKQGVAREAGENYVQLADGRILSGIILDPVPVPAVVPATPAAPQGAATEAPASPWRDS